MTAPVVTHRRGPASSWRPPWWRVAWRRYRIELRTFGRVKEEMLFTFSLPIVLLGLLATIFGGQMESSGVEVSQYFVASMLATTGITVGFQSLSSQLALEQHDGTLKRLAGTPMPKSAYMAGKFGMVGTVAAFQGIVMFVVGVSLFGLELPDLSGWAMLGAVLVLNLAIWTLLGLAASRLMPNPRASGAVALLPALVLQFVSGVYVTFDDIPPWLRGVASAFPLRWAALGLRQALLPDGFSAVEPGGWQTGRVFVMLVGWLFVGAVLAGLMFRWRVRE